MIRRMTAVMLTLMLIFGLLPTWAGAAELGGWSRKSPYPTAQGVNSVVYGGDKFVAVGYNGVVLTSVDGVSWDNKSSGTTNSLSAITYGNGLYVAVGYTNMDYKSFIMTSVDGSTWTPQVSNKDGLLLDVTYANGVFVAVGGKKGLGGIPSGTTLIMTSSDGITWVATQGQGIGRDKQLVGITYGNGTFVAVGGESTIFTSSNGTNWSITYSKPSSPFGSPPNPGLTLSSGTVSPSFDANTTSYAASVANSVSSVTVTAAVYDPAATVTVNGTAATIGQASAPISLSVGRNTITVIVKAQDGRTKPYTITVERASASSDPTSDSPNSGSPSTPSSGDQGAQTGFQVIVDGKPQDHIATGSTTKENGQTVLTATVDPAKLAAQLAIAGDKPVIVIPASTTSADKVTVVLTGDAVKAMENKQVVLEVQAPNGNYKLPAAQIVIDRLASQFGGQVKLSDIVVHVDIAKSEAAKAKVAESTAEKGKFTVVVPPIDFTVTALYNGKTVDVDKFSSYVKREIPLPDGVDPSKITTAIVLDTDGTPRHVPTYITARDGKYYAVVSSLTNSTYTLILHRMAFVDVEGHWAKGAVNDMASRMVVGGVDATHYNPDAAITRAEFAAIIVRALGLADNGKTSTFGDVKSGDWYIGAVAKAKEYGIIEGYEDGTFGPTKTITREEAMAMIARVMKWTGLNASASSSEAESALASFTDGAAVNAWAKQAVAATVRSGLVQGRDAELKPMSDITRAETAAIVQRMLEKAKLIDNRNSK